MNPRDPARIAAVGSLMVAGVCLLTGCFLFVAWPNWPGFATAVVAHVVTGIVCLALLLPILAQHLDRTRSGRGRVTTAAGLLCIGASVAAWLAGGSVLTDDDGTPGLDVNAITMGFVCGAVLLFVAWVVRRPRERERRGETTGVILVILGLAACFTGISLTWLAFGDGRLEELQIHGLLGLAAPWPLLLHGKVRRRTWARVGFAGLALVEVALIVPRLQGHDVVLASVDDAEAVIERSFRTATIPEKPPSAPLVDLSGAGDSFSCGAAGCHEELTRQWAGSAHRFSADNRFYLAVVELLISAVGPDPAMFCARCHDPMRVWDGSYAEAYADGRPPPGEGVGCNACHAGYAASDPELLNGKIAVRDVIPYRGGNRILKLAPAFHAANLRPANRFIEGVESCAPCHRVQPAEAGTHYQGFVQDATERGADPQVLWDFALEYCVDDPDCERSEFSCNDCHMAIQPLTTPGMTGIRVYTHQSGGINLDLPLYARTSRPGDEEALAEVRAHTEAFLYGTFDLGPLPPDARTPRMELQERFLRTAPFDLELAPALGGTTLELTVETTNRRAGHAFPIGPYDLHDTWQEVRVLDGAGLELVHVGGLDEDGRVDPEAARLGAVELGVDGRPIRQHRIWELAEVAGKRLIAAGGTVTDSYSWQLPEDVVGPLRIEVSWNHRRAPPEFVDWAFGGDGPEFPVHVLASAEATLDGPPPSPPPAP